MRIVLSNIGTFGDINPLVALALELKRRGHTPVMALPNVYRPKIEPLGLDFHAIRPDIDRPDYLERMMREAQACARLSHPNIVTVFEAGQANGAVFIAMEFLQGESLGSRLTTCGRLSAIEAVRTLLPIADVLFVAHQRGIVHRDLKPENVFLAKSGTTVQPKLLDFGIAKLRRDREPTESVITDVGALVGSPAYSSPEQVDCREDVGQAADIWSFCVVLYECLTGALPFDSETYDDLLRQIGSEPPLSILAHGTGDVELWEILRRGLSKDPAARWSDMQSLGRALAGWLRARGVEDDISGIRLDARWLPKLRAEAVLPDAGVPRSEERPRAGDPRGAVGVRPTLRAPRRSKSNWLAVGALVAAAVPVAIGYGVAAPRPAERPEAPKPAAPAVIELPPQVVPSAQARTAAPRAIRCTTRRSRSFSRPGARRFRSCSAICASATTAPRA